MRQLLATTLGVEAAREFLDQVSAGHTGEITIEQDAVTEEIQDGKIIATSPDSGDTLRRIDPATLHIGALESESPEEQDGESTDTEDPPGEYDDVAPPPPSTAEPSSTPTTPARPSDEHV